MSSVENQNGFSSPELQEEFVSLFFASQSRLLAYILSLVPNINDSEDILQEVWNIMWRKFDQYEQGTDFTAWGRRIAYYLIIDHRRRHSLKHVIVNDQLFEVISKKTSVDQFHEDNRMEALSKCLKKLSRKDRILIKLRYFENVKPGEIAAKLNSSANSIYKSFSYLHGKLLLCIKRTLRATE